MTLTLLTIINIDEAEGREKAKRDKTTTLMNDNKKV